MELVELATFAIRGFRKNYPNSGKFIQPNQDKTLKKIIESSRILLNIFSERMYAICHVIYMYQAITRESVCVWVFSPDFG